MPNTTTTVEREKYDAFNNLIERKIWSFIDMKVLTRVETNDVCKNMKRAKSCTVE